MRLASIDIGTNSTRLMVAEKKEGCLKTLYRGAKITRLGEGIDAKGVLSDAAMERTIMALKKYKQMVEDNNAVKMSIVATSAVRDATNSQIFIDRAKKEVDLDVSVLAGKEEARLSFLGATHCHGDNRPILVVDIGGGSTELIFGKPGHIEKIFSLDIGSVRLTEMFVKNDPPLINEVESIKEHIYLAGKKIYKKIGGRKDLLGVGLAGTITTLSAVSQNMEVYDPKKIHGSTLLLSEIERILKIFLSKNLSERKIIVGLESERADIIISGTLILTGIMKGLGLKEMMVSEHDILDGLILSIDT